MHRQTTTDQSNGELIARCLRGESDAWAALVDRYAALVHSVPVRHGLAPMEVDDVGQDVFLALARNLDRIESPDALPAWLLITARRLSWRAVQKRRREENWHPQADGSAAPRGTPLSQPLPTIDALLSGWARQEAIQAGFARLDTKCRALLELLFLDRAEPVYEEISARLGIAVGSIGPTRSRCLHKLRGLLEGLGFGPGDEII